MPLPSFLQRLRGKADSAQPEPEQPPLSASDVEATRVRARRRLIGMVVLVGAGIIGFPWLFETQPRPMSQDVQMVRAGDAGEGRGEIRPAGKVAMVQVPAETPPVADGPVSQQASPEGDEGGEEIVSTAPPVRSTPAPQVATPPAPKPESKAVVKPEPKAEAKPEHKPEPRPEPKPKAEPKPEPKAEAKPSKSVEADGARYVVQFGAFSDGITAHEARMKVERLGLKTYMQEVKTPQGTRIRVRMGPYANRAEAEKVLASLRKAGLGGAVLTL